MRSPSWLPRSPISRSRRFLTTVRDSLFVPQSSHNLRSYVALFVLVPIHLVVWKSTLLIKRVVASFFAGHNTPPLRLNGRGWKRKAPGIGDVWIHVLAQSGITNGIAPIHQTLFQVLAHRL